MTVRRDPALPSRGLREVVATLLTVRAARAGASQSVQEQIRSAGELPPYPKAVTLRAFRDDGEGPGRAASQL